MLVPNTMGQPFPKVGYNINVKGACHLPVFLFKNMPHRKNVSNYLILKFQKEIAYILSSIITFLFNKSIQTSIFPNT